MKNKESTKKKKEKENRHQWSIPTWNYRGDLGGAISTCLKCGAIKILEPTNSPKGKKKIGKYLEKLKTIAVKGKDEKLRK